MKKLRCKPVADIEAIEKTPIKERLKALNTYDLLKNGAAINPEAPAISFFLTGEGYASPQRISYLDFISKITQTANLFHDLGVGPKDVISYLLPNLPETHYVLWGGEAAGIVNPINSLLAPATIRDICQAAGTKVLVALGEFPGADIWEKVSLIRKDIPGLKAIVRVMGPGDEKEGIYSFGELLPRYPGDRLVSGRTINPEDIGLHVSHRRHHRNTQAGPPHPL